MNSKRTRPDRSTWKGMEPPLRETWGQVVQELTDRMSGNKEQEPLLPGKKEEWVSIGITGGEKEKVNIWEPCEKYLAQCIWIVLWVVQMILWGCLIWEMNKNGNTCKGEEVIALVSDPGGFQRVKQVELVPVTCVTKNFTKWGCQPEGAYPDPEVEYRNISQEILEEVYKREWPWNTYHWPLWQMENMRQWMKENKAEYDQRTNKTKEDIDDLLAGKIRGRFCVPYPYALLKCTEWCWYPAHIDEESGRAKIIKINCTKARAVSCTEKMPLASIHRAYWDKEEKESMQFMNIKACRESKLRCEGRPGGCMQGYPIPVGAEIIPEGMKYLRGKKSQYGGIKDKNGELTLPLTVRVWVKLSNNSAWVNGTPPHWNDRIKGSKGINGTLWGELKSIHHLGFALDYGGKWCNFTKEIRIGQEKFPYYYKPSWNCSANWTEYPTWQVTRYLDMVEHMTGECVQRPERHNITVGNGTITGNCSVTNWDGCNCTRSGNYLYNSTNGGLLVIICRQNKTITGIMGTNTNWTTMWGIFKNCSGCENETLDRTGDGTLGNVKNENCSLPHRNESNKWTCAPRWGKGGSDSLYIAGGRQFWTRVKAQYSCESNVGELDGMLHQQMLLQKYQVIKVRAYTYGVVEMPDQYLKTNKRRKRSTEVILRRRKRGIGLVIVMAIMAIIAAAGAGLGVANAVQQSYTRTAVQSLANATAAQQEVLEAAYAMVQHVAKGVRILEARVARVEAIVDRMMLYHELDCWHYHHFCVTSTKAEVAKYINWTRFKDNCTWQQWEEEIEQHEQNVSALLREAALRAHIASRDASRIPDVWTALQEAFDWSGWFAWLKYIPWIIMGIIGFICFRVLMCIVSTCMQAYKQVKEIRYTQVTVVIEQPLDLEGKPENAADGLNGSENLKQGKRTSQRTFTQIWRALWMAWRSSTWSQSWKTIPYMSVLPLLAIQQWIQESGWNGERTHKNKKERVDCRDREQMPTLENDYVELS
uniref:Env protein n=1 Tax=Small ruminant lentivirus TaxID=254355 RepID=A0A455LJG1_CAEV|nr:env protein [Small ruminant lentivirus]